MHVAFRYADKVAGLVGGNADFHGPGIRQPDVFCGKAKHPAGDIQRILAALQHAHHPVNGSVGVRIPHGFMKRGNQVVVLLAVLVVHQALPAQALGQGFLGHLDAVLAHFTVEHDHFQGAQGTAGVAVAEVGNGPQGAVRQGHMLFPEAALVLQGTLKQQQDVFPAQGLQHEDLAPGQERAVHLEGRILGGGADQHDAALLHKGKESVLLRLVKAVDFVHKHDSPYAEGPVFLSFDHHLADFLDAARHGGKIDEICPGGQGDDPCQGGFPDTGRSPEDHGGNQVGGNQPAQDFPGADQMLLSGDFVQCPGTHAGSQGLSCFRNAFGKQGRFIHGGSLLLYNMKRLYPKAGKW